MLGRSVVLALVLAAPLAASAQAPAWEVDAAHTHIGFSVRHLMVSNVKGEFTKYKVKIDGDAKDAPKAGIDVAIDVASINTGVADRDKHLKSPDFFDAAKFPTITFKSKKITKAGKGLKIAGVLTIRGVAKDVVLEAKDISGPIKDPWGNQRLGLTATTKIDRRQFGLTWNKALEAGGVVVGTDVNINLEIELMQKGQPAPAAAK
ncbi:MAG TPA: YceI family protein [Polyangia bacterium]|jgi:polyisoprenoid-binding protein YceI